jgi:N-acetylglucosaminyl-diphospho-decaprenol L-rhamnosyltransferase
LTPELQIPEARPARVSVVIVSLNRVEWVRQSIEALGDTHQVTVVDNGSTDGGAGLGSEYPNLKFHRLPRNFGLTKALNIGIRSCDGEYILLLHDDALISAEAVTKLADYLEAHPEVGAVAPKLTDETGKAVKQVRALPTPSAPDPPFQPVSGDGDTTIECVSGAAIMVRSFFLRALRHVDERYGTYGSDIEICAQIRRSGKKLVIPGGVTALHRWAVSPVSKGALEGDRVQGSAAFLGKHHGLMSGLTMRLKAGLTALVTLHFSRMAGAWGGQKIDGGG